MADAEGLGLGADFGGEGQVVGEIFLSGVEDRFLNGGGGGGGGGGGRRGGAAAGSVP